MAEIRYDYTVSCVERMIWRGVVQSFPCFSISRLIWLLLLDWAVSVCGPIEMFVCVLDNMLFPFKFFKGYHNGLHVLKASQV